MTEQVFDKQTTAGYLGISAPALDELIREGVITAIGTGKAATVSLDAIKTYLERFRDKSVPVPEDISEQEQQKVLSELENQRQMPLSPRTKRVLDILEAKGVVEAVLHPYVDRILGYRRVQVKAA